MLLQPDKSDFILATIKEVKEHKPRSYWKLMKNSEVNNKHKNKYVNLKTILSMWYFKCKIFPYGGLMKYKSRLCAHGGIKQ